MTYNIKLLELPGQPTLGIRKTTRLADLPQFIGSSYGSIMQHLTAQGELPAGAPFVAYYNLDMEALDVEAAFPLARALPAAGDIQPGFIPAGQFVSCFFTGPYDELVGVYAAMDAWMKERSYEPTGIAYEIYYNNPNEKPGTIPETEVRFALKGA